VGAAGRMGYYKDPTDGDGLVTPFKPAAGDQWWYKNAGSDTNKVGFDPLGEESAWLPGGLQVTLDSAVWQGVKMEDWGDSLKVKANVPFGFTLQNDTKVSDIGGGTDVRMEILSGAAEAPYHSIKFYEIPTANNTGWQIREFEWGMYVVIEYTEDRPPVIEPNSYSTTLNPAPRPISATITDDNPAGGAAGVASAYLKVKIGSLAAYDSVAANAAGSVYTASTPAAAIGDTIYWYYVATDVNGNRAASPIRSYKIFQKTKPNLLVYNNAQYSLGTANLIYTGSSSLFDRWSAPTDGVAELGDLLAQFSNVIVADGSFPSRDVYPAVAAWLASGTAGAKKNLFFTSQDYGCYVNGTCLDTTFVAGSWEYDYLGIETLGPQDLPPTNREYRLVPHATNTITSYLAKFGADSGSTLWYDPTFELAFAGYQDALTPTAAAETLFTNAAGSAVHGVAVKGATFNTAFVAFDAGALQFRSDTSLAAGDDPEYWWIVDAGSISLAFFDIVSSVKPVNEGIVNKFSLGQNYPNPFNPTTTFEYSVPVTGNVEITIYNVLGQKIATLINDVHEAGQHKITWNGRDSFGRPVATGVYFYQMNAGSFEQVKKMMLMK
jgi:hypothetical protein